MPKEKQKKGPKEPNNNPADIAAVAWTPLPYEVLESIKKKLILWNKMAGKLRWTVIILGTLAIAFSLFVTAFTGVKFLGEDVKKSDLVIKISAFTTSLFHNSYNFI